MEKPRIIKKINQVNEHIKIPYIDKVVDGSVVIQRQKPLNAEPLKDLRGLKYRCLTLEST